MQVAHLRGYLRDKYVWVASLLSLLQDSLFASIIGKQVSRRWGCTHHGGAPASHVLLRFCRFARGSIRTRVADLSLVYRVSVGQFIALRSL